MYLIKNLIEIYEVMKAEIKATKRGPYDINWFPLIELKISTKAANDIAGIPSKKENFAASTLCQPSKRAIVMVIPDLETPGIIANDWDKPIRKLFKKLWFSNVIYLFFVNWDKYINKAVRIEIIPINTFERRYNS